jgi:hypothetical protein
MRSRAQRLHAAPHFLAPAYKPEPGKVSCSHCPHIGGYFGQSASSGGGKSCHSRLPVAATPGFHNAQLCADASELDQFSANAHRSPILCAALTRGWPHSASTGVLQPSSRKVVRGNQRRWRYHTRGVMRAGSLRRATGTGRRALRDGLGGSARSGPH